MSRSSRRTSIREHSPRPLRAATGASPVPLAGCTAGDIFRKAIAIADHREPDDPLVFVNAAFEKLTGYSRHDVIGRNCRFLQCPETDPASVGLVREALAQNRAVTVDLRNVRKNGELFWNRLHITPLCDRTGATLFILATQADVTHELARDEAEAQLESVAARLAEHRHHLSIASAVKGAAGYWQWDVRAGRLFADARFAELCVLDPIQAARGLPTDAFFKAVHPADRMRLRIAVAGIMHGTDVFAKDYRVIAPDGSLRWVSARGLPERNLENETVKFSGILTDATEQKRVEEQLRIAQKAGGIGTFEYIGGFGTLTVSEQFCRLLGLQPTDTLPVRTVNALVQPNDLPLIDMMADNSAGELAHREVRIARSDTGEVRYIARRGEIQSTGNASEKRFVGAIYDITSFKESEDKLRHFSDTLEAQVRERTRERDRIWNNSRDLLAIVNSDLTIRGVSPSWGRVLGFEITDLVGRRFPSLLHPDDAVGGDAGLGRAQSHDGPVDVVNRVIHKDGSFRWIAWNTSHEGDLIFAYGRDITQEKAREDNLRETEGQLRQAQKMEAVGQLTGGIAHDFNNMLTGVIGGLQMMRRRLAHGRHAELEPIMEAVVNSAQRAASLTHRLLAFSRRQPLDPKAVDVNALIVSMEDLLHRTLGEQTTLKTVLDPKAWLALSDVNQLESAVLNLAINARDAMPDGGDLTIVTANETIGMADLIRHPELIAGDFVTVSVSNSGTGMEPGVAAKAFDPFFTTKPIGQGTGLGLSMIYGFMQQTNGNVRIQSEPGRGTTIKLFLRRCLDRDGAMPVTPILAGTALRGGSETVLVVEDDKSVRLLIVEILKDLGYSVLAAPDGDAALLLVQTPAAIDLLITDVGLPGMNGRQLAELARERRPHLRVLFVTGYAEKAAIKSEFLSSGMDIVAKPFAVDAFGAKVREMIEGPFGPR